MNYLSYKFYLIKVVGISYGAMTLLVSCNTNLHCKLPTKPDKSCPNVKLFLKLRSPDGIVLPIQNHSYDIPILIRKEKIETNKTTDIYPPVIH